MNEDAGHQKTLFRVITWGTALSFGILAALAVSMKDFLGGNAAFDFSFLSVVGFVAGVAAGWLFWRFVFSRAARSKNKQSGST